MLTEIYMNWTEMGFYYMNNTAPVSFTPVKTPATACTPTSRASLRGPRSMNVTCSVSANASSFLVAVDTSPTTTLETAEDTPESGSVELSAKGTLEGGEHFIEHDSSKPVTMGDECFETEVIGIDANTPLSIEKAPTTLESISGASLHTPASCPPQEEMSHHGPEPSTQETRYDAIDADDSSFREDETEWDVAHDNDILYCFSYNRLNLVLDSMLPQLAPHIVVTPPEENWEDEYIPWQNLIGPQWSYNLCVPLLDYSTLQLSPYTYEPPVSEAQNYLLNATSPDTFNWPMRIFNPSLFKQSIAASPESHFLTKVILKSLQKALCGAAFSVASDIARVLRERYDNEPNVLANLDTPFTWTDPAEPIIAANRRILGATLLDSICPFLAPHILINEPPPQPSQLTENNATPYTQDAAFGDRLTVRVHSTEVINEPEDWDSQWSCASSTTSDVYWTDSPSRSSSTVDLLETLTESRPGSPLPETPVDDRHFYFVRHEAGEDEPEEGGLVIEPIHYGTNYDSDSCARSELGAEKLPATSRPRFFIDEDDDELPSLDDW